MKKIADFEQLKRLVKPWLKKGIATNNYLLPDAYEPILRKGALYYAKAGQGLLLLVDHGNHFRLYYYLAGCNSRFLLPRTKPSAMEILFAAGDQSIQEIIAYWEGMGFKAYQSRRRMSVAAAAFTPGSPAGEEVVFADRRHAAAIHALLAASFDPYLGDLPTVDEIKEGTLRQEFICVPAADNKVKGVLRISRRRNVYLILHLALAPQYRRRGLAGKMLAYFNMTMEKKENTAVRLWVQPGNAAARRLYEQAGFRDDGWEAVGLLYLP